MWIVPLLFRAGLSGWRFSSHRTSVLRPFRNWWKKGTSQSRIRRRLSVVPFLTCGNHFIRFFFFCVAGLDTFDNLLANDASNGFMSIIAMEKILGWKVWPLIYGCISILLGMLASILGFWMSTVRMLYSMGKNNFLPQAFMKLNRHQQPILPNIFLLVISLIFILLQNARPL